MLEFDEQAQGDRPQLALHVKADVQGSAEAVRDAVEVSLLRSSHFAVSSLCCLSSAAGLLMTLACCQGARQVTAFA